jgi:hypothetical protein
MEQRGGHGGTCTSPLVPAAQEVQEMDWRIVTCENDTIWINLDAARTMRPGRPDRTILCFGVDSDIEVRETPEQIYHGLTHENGLTPFTSENERAKIQGF